MPTNGAKAAHPANQQIVAQQLGRSDQPVTNTSRCLRDECGVEDDRQDRVFRRGKTPPCALHAFGEVGKQSRKPQESVLVVWVDYLFLVAKDLFLIPDRRWRFPAD